MNLTNGKKQYFLLALLMTFVLYSIYEALAFTHELGHGLTAMALGGYFPFVQVDADGGRSVFFFPLGSPRWKEAVVLLAGPTFNFLTAVLTLGILAVGVKNKMWRLFWALVGGVAALMVINVSGLFPPWWRNYKETGEALEMVGLPFTFVVAVKCVWLIIGALLVISFFRLFFRELAEDFPTASYRQRLALVTSVLIGPAFVIMGALSIVMFNSEFGEGVMNPKRHWPHMILLALTFLLMPFVITSANADKPVSFSIPRTRLLGWGCVAVAIVVTQATVFGNSRTNPRGLFLMKAPPEVNVEACNVSVTIGSDDKAHVRLLMRSFSEVHNFLWTRANQHEPSDWQYYDQFANANLRVLLGTDNFEIVGRYADPSAKFFSGSWGVGARVIEAEAPMSSLTTADAKTGRQVFKLVDFWRSKLVGFIDFTEVNIENSREIKSVRSDPPSATPVLRSAKQLQWVNTDFPTTFASTYVTLE